VRRLTGRRTKVIQKNIGRWRRSFACATTINNKIGLCATHGVALTRGEEQGVGFGQISGTGRGPNRRGRENWNRN
jgi:hypothetical protein